MEIFVVLAIGLFILLAIAGAAQASARRKALGQWASEHTLSFDPGKDFSFDSRFEEFGCLRQGDDRYAFHIMEGDWSGRFVIAFDYHYETESKDSKGNRQTHSHYFSAVILRSRLPLKPLSIRPEGLFDRITEFFGADDIDFESAEFSRAFYVKSPDRKWAFDVLHARAMEFLLAAPRFNIQFGYDCIICWRDRRFNPGDFTAAIELVGGILDRLPEYVTREMEEAGK